MIEQDLFHRQLDNTEKEVRSPFKEAIFLTDRLVDTEFERRDFIYGKDKLVEKIDERIDVTKRQTPEVLAFKKIPGLKHNELFDKKLDKGNKH